ncbi:YusW family protein [Sporosarcina sp. ACRSL]|uniref:YusW family protein n=1 Tax=Sporosarcina sp. ACRSL TaxID=2918215 RepID=UPI001EF5C2ED|nr:YusW family protein [Sporosarcina sp. ACRSL]MCG7343561.1 YusW family protein [Sporosarcina sp. ACRSL]
MKINVKVGMLFLFAALILGACGNASENADDPKREDADIIYKDEKEGGTLETGDGYGFNKFDLEIEVDGRDTIDAEYEVDRNHKAKYVNELAGINLEGAEAFNKLDEMFTKIMLESKTSQQDVIDGIMEWFGLDTYTKFELEINYDDGTKVDIEDRK